jgi:hypothetical protein
LLAARRFRDFDCTAFILDDFFATTDFFDFVREVMELEAFFFFAAWRGESFRGVRTAGGDACAAASSWLTIAAAFPANSCVVATALPKA